MLALALRHFLREVLKVELSKHRRLLLGHYLPIVRAARSPRADPERLAAECAVGRGHQHLRPDVLLVRIIAPGELAQPAARPVSGLAAIARPACVPNSTATDNKSTFFNISPPPLELVWHHCDYTKQQDEV